MSSNIHKIKNLISRSFSCTKSFQINSRALKIGQQAQRVTIKKVMVI